MTKSGSNHTPYHTAYSKIWRMILGRMYALKCKKAVVNHFKNRIEAMVMKEKTSPTNHTQFTWLKTVNKRAERSSQSYDKSNVSPYGSCYHSFCMRSSGVWKRGCVLPNWWRYGVWYVVVGYEWMIRTASCRINHTLVRDDAGRTKLNQIRCSLFLFFLVTNPTCSHEKK